MKKCIVVVLLSLLCMSLGFSQDLQAFQSSARSFSIGTGLVESGGDFGLQLNVATPWFAHGAVSVKAAGMMMYDASADWKTYWACKLGVVGGSFMSSANIRLYGEGGMLCVFPPAGNGTQEILFGGYGHFGFEFFIGDSAWIPVYFMELGAGGVRPSIGGTGGERFMNGFSATVGLRWVLHWR